MLSRSPQSTIKGLGVQKVGVGLSVMISALATQQRKKQQPPLKLLVVAFVSHEPWMSKGCRILDPRGQLSLSPGLPAAG